MNVESAKGFVYYGNFVGAYDKWLHANKRWKAHWFETCVEIYQKSRKWARDFVIDLKNKVISKIPHSKVIVWNCEKIDYPKGTELFYLIRAVTKDNELIFSKVGTTTRAISLRMLEHLKYYKNIGVYRIYIDKVYDCGFQCYFVCHFSVCHNSLPLSFFIMYLLYHIYIQLSIVFLIFFGGSLKSFYLSFLVSIMIISFIYQFVNNFFQIF